MNSTKTDIDRPLVNTPAGAAEEVVPSAPQACQVDGMKTREEDQTVSRGSGFRFMLATMVGLLASVPLGWLLSKAAQLPFFLGLFFFPLFGLMIGAAMYRTAHGARPYNTFPVLVGTTIVVLFCWLFSLFMEARDMPVWVAANASRNPRLKLHDQTIEAYRSSVADDVAVYLRQTYPPGGLLGYIRWVSSNGEITNQVAPGLLRPIHAPQRGIWWLVRAVLTVGLLAFGIGSQTFILRPEKTSQGIPA